ncbi:hypothetical protein PpBr36_00621 [Pyricularia pennisetigena]|uniref:hypothetical protein n=1 Tax=Pyricularia pennisetigena TaxID=1578925 RepID=UPI001151D08A|nr:hypothetical protein PpBr36_00621 [Pyricularia pennisetigena]TLS29741.1 hypothetical protein PpBr36_00621 [Pyricularia pennisetigena]
MQSLLALLFLHLSFLSSQCAARALLASSDAPSHSISRSSVAAVGQASAAPHPVDATIETRSQRWPPSAGANRNKTVAGGYHGSCINCRLFGKYEDGRAKDAGGLLSCDCDYPGRPGGFRRRESVVNLNDWLGNVQGKLTWAGPGQPCAGFVGSCTCQLFEGRYLSCGCHDAPDGTQVVDLNEHIANKNGVLKVVQ